MPANQSLSFTMLRHLDFLNNGQDMLHVRSWRFNGEYAGALSPQASLLAEKLWPSRDISQPDLIEQLAWALKEHIKPWMDEPFTVRLNWESEEITQIPRASVQHLAIEAYGVHANGYTWREGEPWLWVAKRSLDKPTFPGQWDNMVGGGLTAGFTPNEILAKESIEEASIEVCQALAVTDVGSLFYAHSHESALRRDRIFVYDIELPADIEPTPNDNEVERFELWSVEQTLDELVSGDNFKYNCAVITIDFLERMGQLNLSNCPDHAQIKQRLAQLFKRT